MGKGTGKKLKVLLLEPYYGGSHKSFLHFLQRMPFDFELLELPARKWKWRMRLSAPYFAERLHKTGRCFDRVICSSFVDVAAFRGMAPSWVREVPLLLYFHENQLSYPVQVKDERDIHFALTNITSALSSDAIAFNSAYNFNSFLDKMEHILALSIDMKLVNPRERIGAKSVVLPPAVDFSLIDAAHVPTRKGCATVLWNHRWEHDKNPDLFFSALFALADRGVDFRVIVLGQSFARQPPIFRKAVKSLGSRIIHFGYVKRRDAYVEWLMRGDIVVSTTVHEFFGMAVIEAVRAGCIPILPRRLVYPEIFPEKFLYEDAYLPEMLEQRVTDRSRLSHKQALALTERFSVKTLTPLYRGWIEKALLRD